MKLLTPTYLIIAFCLLLIMAGCKKTHRQSKAVPSLEEVSGIWVSADTVAMEPSIRNFRGVALVNRDVTSISWFASAPYSGGYHTGVMKINGEIPTVSMFRWQPYQALRKGTARNWSILSSTRMLPDKDGVLWRVEITNTSEKEEELHIDLDLIGFISKYDKDDWQWWYPYPKTTGKFTTRDDEVEFVRKNIGKDSIGELPMVEELVNGKPTGKKVKARFPSDMEILECPKYTSVASGETLLVSDTETDAKTLFGFVSKPNQLKKYNSGGTASWTMKLKPGEKTTLEYLMTYGDNESQLKENASGWAGNFDAEFNQVEKIWKERWNEIFIPGNSVFAGCFPTLETKDSLARKVYYTGPLTMLYMLNTNLPLHKKLVLTGGPKWGASIIFFWDITQWSTILAVTDPVMMKDLITSWIRVDPAKYYGQDNFGGKGVGNAYSANYWALFQLIRSYITVSKDYEFLNQKVHGKTILETLESYATNWKKLSVYGQPGCTDEVYKLADFGDDEWNLLECVPTYKHIVPSFNAGYIWMMRETAGLYRKYGNAAKADSLNSQADDLLKQLMKLYIGKGAWNALYPNNKFVEVRHCMDFMHIGKYLAQDIPDSVRTEMVDFVYRELMTKTWMRAQSMDDVAARNSDRPDHGPLGAYDGWPAGTMDALFQMGYADKALDFYRAIEPVTYEGAWAQSHELWGDNKDNENARVRIAERGWHCRDAQAGIAMSQVMLECFFGFYPSMDGNAIRNTAPVNFEGTMRHVLYGGEYYTITLKNGKPVMEKENNIKAPVK